MTITDIVTERAIRILNFKVDLKNIFSVSTFLQNLKFPNAKLEFFLEYSFDR